MLAAPIQLRPRPLPAEGLEGYFSSSLDLRAGLDMRVIAGTLLPAELWRELQRLQASWRPAQPLPMAA